MEGKQDGSTPADFKAPGISRRTFNKQMAVALAKIGLAGLASGVLANEVKKGFEGVVTDSGIFIPLYEKHDIGINAESIPPDTVAYFRELIPVPSSGNKNSLMDSPASSVLLDTATAYQSTEIRPFSDDILNRLARQQTKIIVGDVNVANYSSPESTNTLVNAYMGVNLLSGLSAFASAADKNVSRRKVLFGLGALGVAWGGSAVVGNIVGGVKIDSRQQNALLRIKARISGMLSDFHPEMVTTFFRNAVMATKLLAVGENFKTLHGGKVPKIAYHVEGIHSGIEDFLQLGADATRQIILSHPKSVLRDIVSSNGGIDKFCNSRLFTLPTDFNVLDGKVTNDNVIPRITDRFVTDTILRDGLRKILAE